MEAKKRSGSERVQPDSWRYPAIERACQGGFAFHPLGMVLPAHRFVEVLDRWSCTALRSSPRPASRKTMSRLALAVGPDPHRLFRNSVALAAFGRLQDATTAL